MQKEVVCVVFRNGNGISCIGIGRDHRDIRTFYEGNVDGRWDGPTLKDAASVLKHLAASDEPCSVPVTLARSLFGWTAFSATPCV